MFSEFKHVFFSFKALFIGDFDTYWFELTTKDLISIFKLVLKQLFYHVLYKILTFVECVVKGIKVIQTVPKLNSIYFLLRNLILSIPILSTIVCKVYMHVKNYFCFEGNSKILMWKSKIESLYWKNLFKHSIENENAHIKLVITGDLDPEGDEDFKDLKFVFSNHRSIFDYVVLQYIFQNGHDEQVVPNYMLTWGSLIKIPGFQTITKIFQRNENYKLDLNKFNLNYDNTRPVILFPEVNVMTKEAKIVHDKLCIQNGTRIFKESLSPRYDSFLKLVDIVTTSKNIDNEYFYNVTLTYYKLEAISLNKANHFYLAHNTHFLYVNVRNSLSWYKSLLNNNQLKLTQQDTKKSAESCKYQLLQIIPSLLECFSAFNRTEKQPLIVRVHIEKVQTSLFKNKSKKKLEIFLENKFSAKDDIIYQFESSLKVKKRRKRSLKNSTIYSLNENQSNL